MQVIVGKVLQGSKLPRYFPRDRECGGLARNHPGGVPWTAKALLRGKLLHAYAMGSD